jgi:hypothetical protein
MDYGQGSGQGRGSEQGGGLPRVSREQIESLVDVVTRAEFTDLLRAIENAPEADRPEVAQQVATVSALRERGIPIPEGLRITTRVFENPDDPRTIATSTVDDRRPEAAAREAGGGTVCVSVGEILCVSYGWEALQ